MTAPDSSESSSGNSSAETMHTVTARENIREQLQADLAEFLKKGGNVEAVAHDYRADPPKKPESNYGRGAI